MSVDTRKAVALLAYLALADRPHSRDALAELLWPGRDAEHARGALRRTLSTLRKAIGEEHVEAARERVALARGPKLEIDVDRFRTLTAPGARESELEEAVALFGGDLLEGFSVRDSPAFEDWHLLEADALRRELGAVLERLVDAREARSDYAGAVRHARRRLELDPLHEPAHRQLIRLMAWSGDRAAALTQYRTCVRTLSSELGVPPLPETTELYRAISDGSLEPAPGVAPPQRPAPRAGPPERPLVGREKEWRALLDAYGSVGPDGRVVVIEGEAGIGKTRLAEAFLEHARARAAVTLASRCYEEEAGLAYAPVVETLRAALRGDPGWLGAVPARALSEAARLLPDLAELRSALPAPTRLEGPGAEGRFLDGVTETLAAATAGAVPGVMLVDDLQWVDEASLDLLGYLVRRLRRSPVLLVLTWRLPRDQRLRRLMAEAERAAGAEVLQLARLSEAEVAELVRSAELPGGTADLERRLYEETEGVPFLLVSYLAALEAASEPERAEWPLPAGVRELIRARVDPVSEVGRQVLGAASVLGRSFGLETVRATGGRSEEETVAALEELVGHGLVEEVAASSGPTPEYDFGHEKVRALVYEETSLARRRLLHRRAADALATQGPNRGGRAALVARHRRLAGQDREAASEYARAAEHARAVYANADALEHLRAALALGHPDSAGLNASVGDLQTLLGDYGGALASYETAAAQSRPENIGELEHRLGGVHHRRGEWELAQARLAAALEATDQDDDARRARIHADLSLTSHERGDSGRAGEHARQARELAERGDDTRALAQALNILGVLARGQGNLGEARRQLERSAALAEELGDPGARAAALNNLALTRRGEGDVGDAIELTRTALELCAVQGDRHREAALHNNLADLLHEAGRAEEAMAALKRAVAIFAEVGADEAPAPEIWKLVEW